MSTFNQQLVKLGEDNMGEMACYMIGFAIVVILLYVIIIQPLMNSCSSQFEGMKANSFRRQHGVSTAGGLDPIYGSIRSDKDTNQIGEAEPFAAKKKLNSINTSHFMPMSKAQIMASKNKKSRFLSDYGGPEFYNSQSQDSNYWQNEIEGNSNDPQDSEAGQSALASQAMSQAQSQSASASDPDMSGNASVAMPTNDPTASAPATPTTAAAANAAAQGAAAATAAVNAGQITAAAAPQTAAAVAVSQFTAARAMQKKSQQHSVDNALHALVY
jgi:hypothetical protein